MSQSQSLRKSKSIDKPFYETPEDRPTSAQIIEETRSWLRTVNTKRPFTPRQDERTLFGQTSASRPESAVSRPPSAISLGSKHFDCESRPVSGTRLTPISDSAVAAAVLPPKPPSAERVSSAGRRKHRAAAGSQKSENGVHDLSEHEGQVPHVTARRNSVPKATTHIQDNIFRESSAGSSSRGSSAGNHQTPVYVKEKDVDDEEFFNTRLAPIVDLLSVADVSRNALPSDLENTHQLICLLYVELENGGFLKRKCKKHRSLILKIVYSLLDSTDPKLLLSLSRLILALKVSANNLTSVCKLLFKVAKEEKNDTLFYELMVLPLLISTMQSTDPGSGHEALVYLSGTLKFLTGNASMARQLLKLDCLETLSLVLAAIVDKNVSNGGKPVDSFAHILVQVLGALRNLAELGGTRDKFLQCSCLASVCLAVCQYPGDADLQLNAARLLSKLTQHADVCMRIADEAKTQFFPTTRELLTKHRSREDLVVRLTFVLGNLTGRLEEARLALFPDKPALDSLLAVLKYYMQEAGSGSKRDSSKLQDCLVKLIRLIANSSITESIGKMCAASRTCLRLLVTILETKEIAQNEELVFNSVSAINNLSYFMTADLTSDMEERMLRVSQALFYLVMQDSNEALTEAVRAYGNLSRERVVRDWLIEHNLPPILIAVLDSGNRETVYCATGVLLNLMADPENRKLLRQDNGVLKLVDALRDLGHNDWQLSGLICKTLWNYTEGMTSCSDSFGSDTAAQDLIDLLALYTDPESADEFCSSAVNGDTEAALLQRELWEAEFSVVGGALLTRLEQRLSHMEPL